MELACMVLENEALDEKKVDCRELEHGVLDGKLVQGGCKALDHRAEGCMSLVGKQVVDHMMVAGNHGQGHVGNKDLK